MPGTFPGTQTPALWFSAPPTLVVHPMRDYEYAGTEGLALHRKLLEAGMRSCYMTFEDEGRWISRPENMEAWYKEVFRFVKDNLDVSL